MPRSADKLQRHSLGEIRGSSEWACRLRKKIARYAPYQMSVLVTGPSGT